MWQQVKSKPLSLTEQEIHVWRAPLVYSAPTLQHLQTLLSADEDVRAKRFHFEKDRTLWIAARGILRLLLSQYLSQPPHTFHFTLNDYGKPYLSAPLPLYFNLSHTKELAIYAFSLTREIGIDIEYMQRTIDYEELARFSFSAFEYAELQTLAEAERHEAFFRCWTRKEAYIKARGMGLSFPLDKFDVSLKPHEEARLLHVQDQPEEPARWSLQHIEIDSNYVGALAVEGQSLTVRYFDFNVADFISL
ncbi:4'-phosphopantetheinyl transferase family protein [Tengunoibacter tsumagoiensis]|uniref:4'-phosphopantetheinyl transferase n=1 Tax=Tengunoibacter tsumagoiensis TaxID=2014871 RepID=A0A402A620_9CHLR|nr:4'-phosphopantetheinyl transferase superfamily protein [Tengunoibacter tsumagoiensis]GCE14597.1 4'-phosphopantetheinyl transferase [Tengunoibacter tsumagoiensis]